MMSLSAMPTHSVRRYGFFSKSPRRRQMPKCANLKRFESRSFSGDRELTAFKILTLPVLNVPEYIEKQYIDVGLRRFQLC